MFKNKKAKRTIDMGIFALFVILGYQSFKSNELGLAMLYTFFSTAIAAAIVVETE